MYKKNFKGRSQKRKVSKCREVCRTYDNIGYVYVDEIEKNKKVKEFKCNVPIDKVGDDEYTTDFVCTKTDGDLMVRECVQRKYLTKPLTVKLLDISRNYWLRHGVTDWGIVINAEE